MGFDELHRWTTRPVTMEHIILRHWCCGVVSDVCRTMRESREEGAEGGGPSGKAMTAAFQTAVDGEFDARLAWIGCNGTDVDEMRHDKLPLCIISRELALSSITAITGRRTDSQARVPSRATIPVINLSGATT